MAENPAIIKICEVISVDDPQGIDRIKVRMIPEDLHETDLDKIPYAFPLLPKIFYSKPKIGEAVLIITATIGNGNSQRYYIGPIIPQIQNMDNNNYSGRALSGLLGADTKPGHSIYKDKDAKGIYPEEGDVSLIGRNNSDILLKDNDVQIRCGVRTKNEDTGSGLEFNSKDPAFIKLRYNENNKFADSGKSSIDIVADNINILGAQSPNPLINIDRSELIKDDDLENLLKDSERECAHRLPYGDVLIDFLKKFRSAFLNHTHPFSMLPPCIEQECKNVSNYDLDGILSNSVRIS